jgi:hypothetical protein
MSTLLKRAAASIEQKANTIKRLHALHEADIVYSGIGELVGVGAGALVDIKMGKDGGQAKLGPIPTNMIAGLAPAALAIFVKSLGRARAPVAALGFGMMGAGLYRFILDKHAEHVANNPPAAVAA